MGCFIWFWQTSFVCAYLYWFTLFSTTIRQFQFNFVRSAHTVYVCVTDSNLIDFHSLLDTYQRYKFKWTLRVLRMSWATQPWEHWHRQILMENVHPPTHMHTPLPQTLNERMLRTTWTLKQLYKFTKERKNKVIMTLVMLCTKIIMILLLLT